MKKYILIACIGFLGLGFTACDDNLDVTPKDTLDIENYFKTESDLEAFSNSFYSSILDNTPYDAQDDHYIRRAMSNELKGGSYRTTPASGGGWTWTALRKINTLLEYAPKNCTDEDAKTKYIALARFFRAAFYFDKVKRFGDVPWIDRQLFSDDPELYAERDSREVVLTHMIEDIDAAIEGLPDNSQENNVYRVTKGAALALKSRFCLFEGTFRKYHGISLRTDGKDWEYYLGQCVDASEKLMSGQYGKYKVYKGSNPETNYRDLFTQANATTVKDEFILAAGYSVSSNLFNNVNDYAISKVKNNPSATRKFICSYLMKDGSRFTDKPGWQTMEFKDEIADRDPRLTQTIRGLNYKRINGNAVLAPDMEVSSTGYQPIKYVTASTVNGNNEDLAGRTTNDMPIFRYSEVLLNLAEAKAELGTLTQPDLDKTIGVIRDRVGMSANINMASANANPDPYLDSGDGGYFNVSGSNKGVILEIRRERAIELFQEHFRYYDLIRWKNGKCLDQPILGIYVAGPCQLDMSGDGKPDVVFYANGGSKPNVAGATAFEIGKDIYLSEGTQGYTCNHKYNNEIMGFNESRDYLYPIPTNDLNLNPNLKQNPNW